MEGRNALQVMGTVFLRFHSVISFRSSCIQGTGELTEYLQRVSVICSGRYSALRYRECRKKSEIRKRKKRKRKRPGRQHGEGRGVGQTEYSKNFTEPGIGRNFHKFKNSVSTENLKKHVT